MQIVLFDNENRKHLFPLTATKAIAALRCGIVTIKERWELKTGMRVFVQTANYLQPLYEVIPNEESIYIDATVFADDQLIDKILSLQTNEALVDAVGLIALKTNGMFTNFNFIEQFKKNNHTNIVQRLERCWQLFQWNDAMIRSDFKLVTKNKSSQHISSTNHTFQHTDIFIEEGASVEFATLNSTTGPIYIAKNAEVWEGATIRGPFALGNNAVVKIGAKIYGATTIGPWCAACGEIKNAIISGYSNKAHDGYLGDSVIGEWCNLGAGTTNSNVKNTGGNVTLWNYAMQSFETVGLKAGVIMGDYSRTAINSSINTGTTIGVSANVFGDGLLRTVIDDFTWGLTEKYVFEKALRDIGNWKKMKQQSLTNAELNALKHIFENE